MRNRVFFDDNKRIGYPGGFIVNGAPFAQELKYPKRENAVYLLGSRYALLRKEFWRVPQKRINKRIRGIMVSAGGANTRGTGRVISRLLDFLPQFNKEVQRIGYMCYSMCYEK